MHIVLFTRRGARSRTVNLFSPAVSMTLILGVAALCGALLYGGYRLGVAVARPNAVAMNAAIKKELEHDRANIAVLRRREQDNMDALALRLGDMQAHVIRLDALGERLTEMAHLDKKEFDFGQPPGEGGPEPSTASAPMKMPDFMHSLNLLDKRLADREQKLGLLESTLMNRRLQAEVVPAGRPVKNGWISSPFGMRTDPFTGRPEMHEGIDFAGRLGSDVMAVAAGVVTWAGPRGGYGNMVEINHGNGYVTRYGHNEKVLVRVGQLVKKGQIIAHMGSTGRSTGPHVHFEVLKNGHPVNPAKFVVSASR